MPPPTSPKQTTAQDPFAAPVQFNPEMPRIPGVNDDTPVRSAGPPLQRLLLAAAAVVVLGGAAWIAVLHASHTSKHPVQVSNVPQVDLDPSLTAHPGQPQNNLPTAPGIIATIDEMAKPWSTKKFMFMDPLGEAVVPAMVVRLPGVAETRSDAYWAFSLNAPYGRCQLDYLTDLAQLNAKYGSHATHPMVAGCDGTLYDPLRIATLPTGAWVRGEVVQGPGIRPPMAIEIRVQGHDIIADQIE